MAEPIYDWPTRIRPVSSLFHSGGASGEGMYSASGAQHRAPEPGGASFYEMSFAALSDDGSGELAKLAGWLFSRVSSGALMRIPLQASLQTARHAALGLAAPTRQGILWDNGQTFDNGRGWDDAPLAQASVAGLEGQMTLAVEMGALAASGLSLGDLVGYGGQYAHKIADIAVSGTVATLTLFTPLRRNVSAGEIISFRPHFVARVSDPAPFRAMFQYGRWVAPGNVTFQEALV